MAISGRRLQIKQAGGGVARIEFDELCNANLGPSDYVALCLPFTSVLRTYQIVFRPSDLM